ncbi:hypothetical protein TNCV_3083881 [Trichonephila clavipes]|nr:hypothetical protein TNCV_3083881 [Trichonephila clavipes]
MGLNEIDMINRRITRHPSRKDAAIRRFSQETAYISISTAAVDRRAQESRKTERLFQHRSWYLNPCYQPFTV